MTAAIQRFRRQIINNLRSQYVRDVMRVAGLEQRIPDPTVGQYDRMLNLAAEKAADRAVKYVSKSQPDSDTLSRICQETFFGTLQKELWDKFRLSVSFVEAA